MARNETRLEQRKKRHRRIRNRIRGTAERPRLTVFRSLRHTYAQVIDDMTGKTLATASTLEPGCTRDRPGERTVSAGRKVVEAWNVGRLVAERALSQGIEKVVFDRAGYRFHGRVRAVAEGARSTGMSF